MVTVNGSFIIALTIIIYLVVIKWIEWYLFQNGSFHLKRRNRKGTTEDAVSSENHLIVVIPAKSNRIIEFGIMLKTILFFGKADLRRPWYVGFPFVVLFILQRFVFQWENVKLYELIGINILIFAFVLVIDMLLMIKANSDFFSDKDRRKRYVRSQLAQLILACVVFAAILGTMQIHFEKKYSDPIGLRDSIEWEIQPTFEADWPSFTEGLASVKKDDQHGFIDRNGNLVIPYRYDDSYNFHEGLAAVMIDKKWGYIDKNGQQIIPCQFDDALDFGDGLAPVQMDHQWMVIDKKGTIQFETDYDMIYPFHEGVAAVDVKDKKYKDFIRSNLIDREGHLLFDKNYTFFEYRVNEGCIPVADNETGKGFFLDIHENKVVPLDLIQAGSFTEGYAPVLLSNEGGYFLIDHLGNIFRELDEDEFYNYFSYSEGLFSIHTGEWGGSGDKAYRTGFQDRYGNIIIPAQFQSATASSEGLMGLQVDGLWGFVKNPLPEAARVVDPELWQKDRDQIAAAEGLPIYAGELESAAYNIKVKEPAVTQISAYKKAFEQLKAEKAFEKYGRNIVPDQIQYQIGNPYYRRLLLEKN